MASASREAEINVTWPVMPDRLGSTNGTTVIRMHPHQSQVQRRCTLAHELAHIELGHINGCSPAEDRVAEQYAARWLIEMDDLLDASGGPRTCVRSLTASGWTSRR